jgi:broad specificity phosphatase PhoE
MDRIVLLRHALAQKNVEDRHGGPGTCLTNTGRDQLPGIHKRLLALGLDPSIVLTSPVPQAAESARILAPLFGVDCRPVQALRPLNLGLLSGLSRDEAAQEHPEAAALMEKWRRGEIELNQLQLPGADDYRAFYERGCRFIKSLADEQGDVLVVGTRSMLICLVSILLGRHVEPGGGYREIPIDCCDFFTFACVDGSTVYIPHLSACVFERDPKWR